MDRITEFKLCDTQYAMNLSVKAFIALSEKYGSVQKAFELISKTRDDGKPAMLDPGVMEAAIDIGALLIEQGAKYKARFEGETFETLTRDDLEVLPQSDYYALYTAVYIAMLKGGVRTVETEEDPKNAEATQE